MSKIVVALDGMDYDGVLKHAKALSGKVWGFKVRPDVFYGTLGGQVLISSLKLYGNVFVDPKCYDITNSQAHDLKALVRAGADLVTIHASGGRTRMKKALEAVQGSKTRLLAVTVLTDYTDEEVEEVYGGPRQNVTLLLANIARGCGIHGLVCSAAELPLFNDWPMLRVMPGFRPGGKVQNDDQVRIAGYEEAKTASLVVVGRPITEAADPVAVVEEMNRGLSQ